MERFIGAWASVRCKEVPALGNVRFGRFYDMAAVSLFVPGVLTLGKSKPTLADLPDLTSLGLRR